MWVWKQSMFTLCSNFISIFQHSQHQSSQHHRQFLQAAYCKNSHEILQHLNFFFLSLGYQKCKQMVFFHIINHWKNQIQMLNRSELEKGYFHNYQKPSRVNNPTFISHFVNDSLTLYTPTTQKIENGSNLKQSEYKSNFQPFNDKVNILSVYQQSHNYAKYSQQAFEKSKSYLSRYGSNLVTNKSQATFNRK